MTTTTTTTTTCSVMPVDTSNALTQGISANNLNGLGAQTVLIQPVASAAIHQGEAGATTSTSLATRTQIILENELDFICFTEIPTCEFANAYPCTFEFGGANYQNATAC